MRAAIVAGLVGIGLLGVAAWMRGAETHADVPVVEADGVDGRADVATLGADEIDEMEACVILLRSSASDPQGARGCAHRMTGRLMALRGPSRWHDAWVSYASDAGDGPTREGLLMALAHADPETAFAGISRGLAHADLRTRLVAMEAVRARPDAGRYVERIAALMKDEDTRVSRAAARLVGEIRDPSSADALVEVVRTKGDAQTRILAARALATIAPERAMQVALEPTAEDPVVQAELASILQGGVSSP